MASYTPNYNLKKPADADTYDIADANGNMDLIDTALHSQNEALNRLLDNNKSWLDSVDLNTLTSTGYYACKSNCTNLPATLWGYLSVIGLRSDTISQTYTSLDNRTFTRQYYGGAWIGWQELALNSKIQKEVSATNYAYNSAEAMSAVYNAFSDGTQGLALLHCYGNYRLQCMVNKYTGSYGSIIAHANDAKPVLHAYLNNGTWVITELATNDHITTDEKNQSTATNGSFQTSASTGNGKIPIGFHIEEKPSGIPEVGGYFLLGGDGIYYLMTKDVNGNALANITMKIKFVYYNP